MDRKSKDVNGSADFVMEINGAYRSPDFIVGSTDVTAWVEQLRTTTVPWLELRGRHVAFSVQRERLLDMIMMILSLLKDAEHTGSMGQCCRDLLL